jgi:hypothetical protein
LSGGFFGQGEESMACEPESESTAKVELKINGEEVALNDFVQEFVAQTLIGMVKSLRGVGEIRTIDLKISR